MKSPYVEGDVSIMLIECFETVSHLVLQNSPWPQFAPAYEPTQCRCYTGSDEKWNLTEAMAHHNQPDVGLQSWELYCFAF